MDKGEGMHFQRAINAILRALFKILLRCQVTGLENIPANGPAILIMNHVSFLDPFLACGLMHRPVIVMSKAENYLIPVFNFVIKLYGSFPVRRGEIDRRALRRSLEVLEEGKILLLAPEGTRSPTHSLQEGKDGMAFVALRSGAAVVPLAISGSENFKHDVKRLRRTPIRLVFGPPFHLRPESKGRIQRAELHHMTDEAMYVLATLLPPEYRGVYSDLSAATQRYVQFEDGQGR